MNEELKSIEPQERQMAADDTLDSILLPEKSKEIYEKEFALFQTWCRQNEFKCISENVLLAYFNEHSQTKKASTLWTIYSILKTCLTVYKNVDISQYKKLLAFLKKHSEGYKPKKSKILEAEDIDRFIKEADDKTYLGLKVILLMGYNGALRRDELKNMSVDHIEYKVDSIFVTVPKTKTNVARLFAITEKLWIDTIKKYASLRPKTGHNRFFVTYRNGYCLPSPIGVNTLGKVPKAIATYLKLPKPELYTGHCLKRSSVSHMANKRCNLGVVRRTVVSRPSSVAEVYVDSMETPFKEESEEVEEVCSMRDAPHIKDEFKEVKEMFTIVDVSRIKEEHQDMDERCSVIDTPPIKQEVEDYEEMCSMTSASLIKEEIKEENEIYPMTNASLIKEEPEEVEMGTITKCSSTRIVGDNIGLSETLTSVEPGLPLNLQNVE